MLLAHPLSPIGDLGAPPLGVALAAAVVVAAVLVYAPVRAPGPAGEDGDAGDRALPARWMTGTRALAVALLALLVYAGRLGTTREIENIAPALGFGLAWPALLVAALLGGRAVWRALDPWDALVRLTERSGEEPGPPASVYAAVPVALLLVGYLTGYLRAATPRAVGLAVAAYTIAAVTVGIALGRAALARTEVVGLAAAWTGRWRRRGLVGWRVPAGAEAVAGALLGGMLFAEVNVLTWWVELTRGEHRQRWVLLGALGCALLGAAVGEGLGRWAAARGAGGSVAAVLVPMLPAYAVATQMRRILFSGQILAGRVSDPFGRGWDLFGTADAPIRFGPSVLQLRWAGAVLLTLAGVLGALVLARRVPSRRAQDPAATALYLAVAVAVFAVTTTVA